MKLKKTGLGSPVDGKSVTPCNQELSNELFELEKSMETLNQLVFCEADFMRLAVENSRWQKKEIEYLRRILALEKKISSLNSQLMGKDFDSPLRVTAG